MAFFHEAGPQHQRFLNAPPSVLWLIGAILAAHTVRALLPGPAAIGIILDYALIPSRPADLVTYVSYMFLHGGYLHAGINSLWLLAFGPPIVWRIGTARFLAFFLVCGIAAALAQVAADWGSDVPVVGASGAVSGLMGGTIRILFGRPRRLFPWDPPPPLAPIYARPVLYFSAAWLIVNLVVGITGLGLMEEGQLIAWIAHMGGFIAGILLIGLFDRKFVPKRPATLPELGS